MCTMSPSLDTLRTKIKEHKACILDAHKYTHSAVFLPLIRQEDGKCYLLFEVRSRHLKTQPGEICFPGGHVQPEDGDAEKTALRETCEELGVLPNSLEIWGALDIFITPFMQIIHPFVGLLKEPQSIKPNPHEVEEVFTLPLERLIYLTPEYHEINIEAHPPDDFPFHKIPRGRNYRWRKARWPELFYEIDGRIIWGLTARILHHFLAIIKT